MSVHDTKSLGSLKASHMGKNLSAQYFIKLSSLLPYSFASAAGLFFQEGISKCSNEINNKLTSTHQHNKYL